MSAELTDPLEWTRRYGYLYPRDLFRAALVGAMGSLRPVAIAACEGEWETRNAAWRAAVAQRFNQPRDSRGRFAGKGSHAERHAQAAASDVGRVAQGDTQ